MSGICPTFPASPLFPPFAFIRIYNLAANALSQPCKIPKFGHGQVCLEKLPSAGFAPLTAQSLQTWCHPTTVTHPGLGAGAARLDTSGGTGRGRREGSWGGKDTAQQPQGSSKGTPAAVEVSQVPRERSEVPWGTWECVSCLWACPGAATGKMEIP